MGSPERAQGHLEPLPSDVEWESYAPLVHTDHSREGPPPPPLCTQNPSPHVRPVPGDEGRTAHEMVVGAAGVNPSGMEGCRKGRSGHGRGSPASSLGGELSRERHSRGRALGLRRCAHPRRGMRVSQLRGGFAKGDLLCHFLTLLGPMSSHRRKQPGGELIALKTDENIKRGGSSINVGCRVSLCNCGFRGIRLCQTWYVLWQESF